MLRIQKRYCFKYRQSKSSYQRVYGYDITFSSYPGFLYSFDDFYLISSGLAVTETSNSVYNPHLWTYVQPVGQVRDNKLLKAYCGLKLYTLVTRILVTSKKIVLILMFIIRFLYVDNMYL